LTVTEKGTLGSGKTSLVNQILPQFANMRVLVVVNDVCTVNIDARRIKHVGEVKALTAGCIGCSDLPAFKQIIAQAKSSGDIDLVIIEPTGIADGREIKDAVDESDASCHCLVLMDMKHFPRNRALNILPTQLTVADVVLLTGIPDSASEEDLLPIMDYVAKHAPGRRVESIPITDIKGLSSLAFRILSAEQQSISRVLVKIHSHEHDHGVYPLSIMLKSGCAFEDIVLAIAPFRDVLLRAKGVVAEREFDFVQGDLILGEASDEYPYANFITAYPFPPRHFEILKYQLLRMYGQKKNCCEAAKEFCLKILWMQYVGS